MGNRMNSTRFMTQEELAEHLTPLVLEGDSYPVGGIPLMVQNKKVYVDSSDSHTMIFGATGSKKTRNFVMPAIGIFARAGESFVVTDPKGELYRRTAKDAKTKGCRICCMNLRDFKKGFAWNPLALPFDYYHGENPVKAMELIHEMATMIIGEKSSGEQFWIHSGIDVLCGFTLLLMETAEKAECTLKNLIKLWNSYLGNRKKIIRQVKEEFEDSIVYQKLSVLDNPSDRTVGSIEAFISMGLNRLSINQEFVDFLSEEGMDMKEITQGQQGIYLIIPDENKSYHFVVSLFLEQLYEVLIHKAQNEEKQELPVRMNFLIDEFGNIPKLENMESMITASRSRNIRFHLIVQGMKQMRRKYEDAADTISGNCNNWIYLYSKEYELLQEISRLCGEVIYENNVRMPLFSEFDLQHMKKEEGEALILSGRNYPCITNLKDITEYPFEKEEMQEQEEGEFLEGNKKQENVRKVEKSGTEISEQILMEECRQLLLGDWKKHEAENASVLTGKESNAYFRPLEISELSQFCQLPIGEKEKWVVGTGPGGMIIAEGFATPKEIESGYAYQKMIEKLPFGKYLKVEDLEWYTAERQVRKDYERWQRTYPSTSCHEIALFGKRRFTLQKEAKFQEVGTYCLEARLDNLEKNISGQQVLRESIPDYGGILGVIYARNMLFLRMSGILENTVLENVPWKRFGETAFEKVVYFQKKLNPENSVLAFYYRENAFDDK